MTETGKALRDPAANFWSRGACLSRLVCPQGLASAQSVLCNPFNPRASGIRAPVPGASAAGLSGAERDGDQERFAQTERSGAVSGQQAASRTETHSVPRPGTPGAASGPPGGCGPPSDDVGGRAALGFAPRRVPGPGVRVCPVLP